MEPGSDEYYMRMALAEAEKAASRDEVPVGAVVVAGGSVIARAHNLTEALNDPTAHAEMQAITAAASYLGGKYLTGCTVYVTVEPCVMCAGAIVLARIPRLVYGADDPKAGACGSVFDLLPSDGRFNHRTEVRGGLLAEDCGEVLRAFFRARRTRPVSAKTTTA